MTTSSDTPTVPPGLSDDASAEASARGPVPRGEARGARLLSDVGEPRNWMLVLTPLFGWRAAGPAGLGWAMFAAVFTAVLPTLILHLGERRRWWHDRRMRRRQDRLLAAPAVLTSVLAGAVPLYVYEAPVPVSAFVTAMVAVLLALLPVTFLWKVSVHSAVASGALAVLAAEFGPWALVTAPLVVLIGWSRVRLRCHTPGQVAVGLLIGAAVGAPVHAILSR
ncbi:hypothetical protein [Streptomyces sp. NPDC048002]|uniref:hypothetical protein n=1 Tax=Streptomyces sp. NPDC048002 TaxID=3154344 RepID=UPI0033E035E3